MNSFRRLVLLSTYCSVYYDSAKNGIFRIFYAKLYLLIKVDSSTNRRIEIISVWYYNWKMR